MITSERFQPGSILTVPKLRYVTKVVSSHSDGEFEKKVAQLLEEGWTPVGGPYSRNYDNCILMAKTVYDDVQHNA